MARKLYGTCAYCHRQLTAPTDRATTAATVDHVMPKCVGGCRKVPCCRLCNHLKGDIHPSVWRWFTESYPEWWRAFRNNREVILACRARWGGKVLCREIGRAPRSDFEMAEAG